MRFACETVVKSYLTAFRYYFIKNLKEGGKTQQEIANILGLTQAAISNYLKKDEIQGPLDSSILNDIASKSIEILETNEGNNLAVMDMVCRFCKQERQESHSFCDIHKNEEKELKENNCLICSKYLNEEEINKNPFISPSQEILQELQDSIELLQDIPRFPSIIPQVQSNLVLGFENPKKNTIKDDAAFPGRIINMEGNVLAIGKPGFGASKHIAEKMILIRKRFREIRSACCIAYNDIVERMMVQKKFYIIQLKDENNIESFIQEIDKFSQDTLDAVIFEGSIGLEPVTYILGISSKDVIHKIEKLLNY